MQAVTSQTEQEGGTQELIIQNNTENDPEPLKARTEMCQGASFFVLWLPS